jgi:uncharacterized membrane protein YccC
MMASSDAVGAPLQPAYLRQAARMFAACAISYGVAQLVGFHEGYWAPMSAAFVTQPALDATFVAARDRVIATLIGAATGLGVLLATPSGVHSSLMFWGAMIPLSILTALRPNLRLCVTTLIILVLVPSTGPVLARPLERICEILLGTLVAIAVTAAVPRRQRLNQRDAD